MPTTRLGLTGTPFAAGGSSLLPTIEDWESYRYLKVRIKSSPGANQSFTLTINGKSWTGQTGAADTQTDVVFDLCAPHSVSGDDDQDTRYPLDGEPPAGIPATEGPMWGINRVTTEPTLSGLASGQTYTITSLKLIRDTFGQISFLPAFMDYIQHHPDVEGVTKHIKPFQILNADGRIRDYWDVERWRIGVFDYLYLYPSISTLLAEWGAWPGWTVVDAPVLPTETPQFHNNDLAAHWLGGTSGIKLGSNWVVWIDYGAEAQVDLYAQRAWDQVKGYPQCGNCWEQEAYPPNGTDPGMPLRINKVIRGESDGIVCSDDTGHPPLSNKEVVAYEGDETPAGSTRTDVQGFYQTGLPYGRGHVPITVEVRNGNAPPPTSTSTWENRRRRRYSVIGGSTEDEDNPFNLQTYRGEFHRVHITASNVEYRGSRSTLPLPAWDVRTTVTSTGDCSYPRLAEERSGRLWLVYRRSALGTYRRHSDDGGRSWSAETLAMADSYFPTNNTTKDGYYIEAHFVYNAGTSGPGKIYLARRGPGDSALSTPTAIQSGGVDLEFEPTTFQISPAHDAAHRWVLSAKISGETAVSEWQSWDNGATFKRVT